MLESLLSKGKHQKTATVEPSQHCRTKLGGKMMRTTASWAATALLSLATAGCGGGGDSANDAASPSAEGIYGGNLSGSASGQFQMLVLENDEFWVLYGTQSSTAFLVAGFIQGAGASNKGSFTSSNLRDYGVVPPAAGTASATYNATAHTVAGSATFPSRTVAFSGGPIAGSLYNYATGAALPSVAGNWTVAVSTGESANLAIGSTGSFTMQTSLGCTSTGSVTPRPSGKNVFNVTVTFGASPCLLPGATATGIALAYPLANGRTQLVAGVRNSAQSAGFAIAGTK